MTDSKEDVLWNMGVKNLEATLKSLRSMADEKKVQKYWNTLSQRIVKFPLECMILEKRDEFERMWAKCLKTEGELQTLKQTWSSDYSEEVLQRHGEDLDQLKKFYSSNRDLIDMITKYDTLWECLANVERQSSDPERLFKNRGAQLLKEEQDRKLCNKLPHLEKAIFQLLEKRRKEGREEFLIHGEVFSNIVKQRWEEHKENNRAQKRSREQKPQSVGPEAKKRHLDVLQSQNTKSVSKDFKSKHVSTLQEVHGPVSFKGVESKVSRSLKMM